MKLSKILKNKLNGKEILGKDNKLYKINVLGEGYIDVYIRHSKFEDLFGFIPDMRDLDTKILQCGVADFTYASEKGLFKKTIELISEIVPKKTSYESSLYSSSDRENLLEYIRFNWSNLKVLDALGQTCFGHILLSSKFKELVFSYKDLNGDIIQGVSALRKYYQDISHNIFPNSHGTDLIVTGTKI